jgi:D-sedoheptulose 7-phosphate isomerase
MQERLINNCRRISTQVEFLAKTQDETLIAIARELTEIFTRGGQLILAGQGPLQAVAQQLATAFSHRLGFERPPLPAVALGGDPVFTAALLADQQEQDLLAREYRSYAERDHMLLLFCTGQPSAQVRQLISQFEEGRALALIGPEKNEAATSEHKSALNLRLPEDSSSRLAELCLICGHLLCELVEGELFGV